MSATLSTINAIHADAAAKAAVTEAAKQRELCMFEGARARCQSLIDDFNGSPIRLVPHEGRIRLSPHLGWGSGFMGACAVRDAELYAAGVRPFLVWQKDYELIVCHNAAGAFADEIIPIEVNKLSDNESKLRDRQISEIRAKQAEFRKTGGLLSLQLVEEYLEQRTIKSRYDTTDAPVVGRILDTGRFTTDVHTCDPQRIFDDPADFIGVIVAQLAMYLKPVEVPVKKAKGKK